MGNPTHIEDLVETFSFLDSWEERYRLLIDMGKTLEPLPDKHRIPPNKVNGCVSQVWLVPYQEDNRVRFIGDSDAYIVRGLIAVLFLLYSGKTPEEILAIKAQETLARLELETHLTPQRSNGLHAMVARIREIAHRSTL